jgi:GTPase Era involved in 16S rRNA processing
MTIILFVGRTGSGKSTLINFLGGKAMFEVGSGIFSKTKYTSYKTIKMNDDNENSYIKEKNLTLIDVPGFTDNLEENIDIAKDILNITKELKQINTFILCLDNQRFTDRIKDFIAILELKFPGFLMYTVMVLTKWLSTDLKRMNKIRKQYQKLFKEEYNVPDIKIFFVGNKINETQIEDLKNLNNQEQNMLELMELKKYLITQNTFYEFKNI